jgi:bifunctional DNase/RNase
MVAATDIGSAKMRVSKVVVLNNGDGICEFVVLNELDGDRHLVIQIGSAEAFALAASLGEVAWGRPMTYQFMAELVRSLGGRIREIRLDALNPGVLVGAPIVVALEMLDDSDKREEGDSAEAVLMRRALTAPPMTVARAEP